MESLQNAKQVFNKKLEELHEQLLPALEVNNLSEVVLYEKLLEIQEQLNKMDDKIKKI